MHIIIRKHELYYKQVNFIVEELELMSIREKHTDKMEEILEKEMYADEGFSEIDEEDQRPETQKVMKQERRQQRKNRRKNRKLRNKIAIVLSLIVSVIAIGYVGTAVFYSTHFFSKTVINGIDCSNKNVKQVEEYLEKEVADYKLTLLEADNKTEVKVAVGDWPYGSGVATGHKNQTIQIIVLNTEGSGAKVYDSGVMRYDNGSNGQYGKIYFDCDTSKFEV